MRASAMGRVKTEIEAALKPSPSDVSEPLAARRKGSVVTPAHHVLGPMGASFKNPWPSAGSLTWGELLTLPYALERAQKALEEQMEEDAKTRRSETEKLKVVKPTWGKEAALEGESHADPGEKDKQSPLKVTWIGHSTTFIEIATPRSGKGKQVYSASSEKSEADSQSVKLLFDPIFSQRAGPTTYTGPSRLHPAPCHVEDLPGCDIVFITHNHYDHLDLGSVKSLLELFPKCRFVVPLGNAAWFLGSGVPIEQISELDWWDELLLSPEELGLGLALGDDEALLRITCVPAQHNSGRAALDQGKTLWCGWTIETLSEESGSEKGKEVASGPKVYFAGDTGYRRHAASDEVCPAFKEIGEKIGPFDLSLIPIWRGGTLSFFSYAGIRLRHENLPSTVHCSPADAVCIHRDVRSKHSIGVHWGTFVGTEGEALEAKAELEVACHKAGVSDLLGHGGDDDDSKGRFGTLFLGETWQVPMK